ncbi:MAG: acyltransferase [Saccharofermentans sp.]|nr:acyltransferase [Saccharofermentans sp.]
MDLKRYANQNIWVSLLRVFMCFVVVQIHFQTLECTRPQKFIHFFDELAVPCFMFISFYFMGKALLNLDMEKFKSRLIRLYAPVLFWNVFYFVAKNIINYACYNELYRTPRCLAMALAWSNFDGLASQLWFLMAQIFDLIAIFIILQFGKTDKQKILFLCTAIVITFIYEYWKLFLEFFLNGPYATIFTIARAMECFPFAACGVIFYWLQKDKKIKLLYFAPIITVVLAVGAKFFTIDTSGWSFGYNGLYNFFLTLAICTFALCLPTLNSSRFKPVNIAINWLGSLTMGIYCTHLFVGWILDIISSFNMNLFPNRFYRDTLIFDAIVFIIGALFTILIKLLAQKTKWKWISYIV